MVAAADFTIANGGRLNPDWFLPLILADLLDDWITMSEPGSDELVTAKVYKLAFTTLTDSMMVDPANQRDRDKSSAFLAEQLKYWRQAIVEYEREIDALEGLVFGPIITPWEGRRS